MEKWQDELSKAVAAGEREFGPLDAHQTVRHNLIRRCEEILAEEALESAAQAALTSPEKLSGEIG